MTSPKNVDDFIKDWNWDEESHEYARQLGAFLLQFIDSLEATGLSAKTLKKHLNNCWCIGLLHCSYWFRGVFSPSMFLFAPSYVYEFKRIKPARRALSFQPGGFQPWTSWSAVLPVPVPAVWHL